MGVNTADSMGSLHRTALEQSVKIIGAYEQRLLGLKERSLKFDRQLEEQRKLLEKKREELKKARNIHSIAEAGKRSSKTEMLMRSLKTVSVEINGPTTAERILEVTRKKDINELELDVFHTAKRLLKYITDKEFRSRGAVEFNDEQIRSPDELIERYTLETREDMTAEESTVRNNVASEKRQLEDLKNYKPETENVNGEAVQRAVAQTRAQLQSLHDRDRQHDLKRDQSNRAKIAALEAMVGHAKAEANLQKFAAKKKIIELEGLLAGQVEASKLFREKVVLEIGKMQGEAKEKNKQAVATQAEVQTKDAEIAKLRAQLTSLEAERDAANSRTAAAETLVHEKEACTESGVVEISDDRAKIHEDAQLRLQNAESFIKRLVKKLREKQDELIFAREQIELIEIANNERMERLEKSNKQVNINKDTEIKTLRDTVARLSEHVQDSKTEIARLSKLLGLENEARASAEKRAASLASSREQLELEMNEFAAVEIRKKLLSLVELGRSLELSGDDFFRLLSNVVPDSVLNQVSRLIIDRKQTRMIFNNPFDIIEEIVNDQRFAAEFAETKMSFRRGLVLEETLETARLSFRKIHPPKGGVCDMEKEDRNELALEYLREHLSAEAFKDLEDKILQEFNSRGNMDWSLKRIENFRTVVSHALLAEVEDKLSPLLNERRVIR